VGDDVGYNPILPTNIDRYFQSWTRNLGKIRLRWYFYSDLPENGDNSVNWKVRQLYYCH
jgi:hypothetical protein